MTGLRRRAAVYVAAALLSWMPAVAQTAGVLYVRPQFDFYFPLDTYADPLTGVSKPLYSSMGFGVGSALDYSLTPWLAPFVRGQFVSIPYSGGDSLQATEGDLGLGFTLRPTDRLSLRLDAMGGLAQLNSSAESGAAYAAGGRLDLGYRLSPAFTISASGGYTGYFGTQAQILSAFEAGIYASYDLSAVGGLKSRLTVEDVKLDAVFPSLYAYYDDNPFGTIKVVNREDAAIRDVKVSFNAGRYMDQPKVCAQVDRLQKGGSVTVPITALFTDSVLDITQNIDAKGEIVVEYSYLGSDRVVRTPIDFQMHHRNAITWSDDRRAAAFVSPTNPAAMWFSKFASGIVRDRLRGDINKPLQYAIGMFEAERLYGLNYVVVPANDYSVKHGLKDYIDSVQFPHQTLSNRGGDCSDLAILFATLMQSVGIEAAFITIPGHIFAAFDTGLDEAKARESFYDPGLLIIRNGEAWIPVEITMVNDGFIKAWRVAAKEWADNERSGVAAFYRLPDCWKVYPSAAFPNVNPRFNLPDEAETAMAFDTALDRFVAREMDPELQSLEAELASSPPAVRANEVGILYANYGMLKESWKQLSDSAKAGYQKAWTNLGNVAYLRKDFKLALSYYQWARQLDASDDNALLGVARCQYELENFDASDAAYAELRSRNPKLAGRFGYLASIFGGEGRAWSLADRFASTSWATSRVAHAAVAAAPVLPVAAPAVVPATPVTAPPASAVAAMPTAPAVPAAAPAAVPVEPATAPAEPAAAAPAPAVAVAPAAAPAAVPVEPAAVPAAPAAAAPAPAVVPAAPVAEPTAAAVAPTEVPAAIAAAPAAPTAAPAVAPKPSPAPPPPAERRVGAELAAIAGTAPPTAEVAPAAPVATEPAAVASVTAVAAAPTRVEPAAPVAAPTIGADLPTDVDLAQKAADAAAQKAALAAEAAPAPTPAPSLATPVATAPPIAPPSIATELPTDKDLVAKAAQAVSQKAAAAQEAVAPAPQPEAASVPAPAAVAEPAPAAVAAPVVEQVAPSNVEKPKPAAVAVVQAPPAPKPEAEPRPAPTSTAPPAALVATEPPAAPVVPPPPAAPTITPQPEPQPVAPPVQEAPVQTAEASPAPLPVSPGKELLLAGFGTTTPIVGEWVIADDIAKQIDPDAFFAKLGAPLVQGKRTFTYSFTAKSDARGRGWVGIGLHVFTPKSYTQKGYGAGDSICIWLTRDPVHLTKDITRLQLYRSTDDWNMDLLDEVPVPESIYDSNRFEVTVDPVAGTVSVSLNGTERLVAKDILDLREGVYVLFRALDTAEFSDFKTEGSK